MLASLAAAAEGLHHGFAGPLELERQLGLRRIPGDDRDRPAALELDLQSGPKLEIAAPPEAGRAGLELHLDRCRVRAGLDHGQLELLPASDLSLPEARVLDERPSSGVEDPDFPLVGVLEEEVAHRRRLLGLKPEG